MYLQRYMPAQVIRVQSFRFFNKNLRGKAWAFAQQISCVANGMRLVFPAITSQGLRGRKQAAIDKCTVL